MWRVPVTKREPPWVAKDATAVIIITLTMCLKIGHGATPQRAARVRVYSAKTANKRLFFVAFH